MMPADDQIPLADDNGNELGLDFIRREVLGVSRARDGGRNVGDPVLSVPAFFVTWRCTELGHIV